MPPQIERLGRTAEDLVAVMPPWLGVLLALSLGAAIGLVVHGLVYRLLARLAAKGGLMRRALVARTRGPARLAAVIAGLAVFADIAPLSERAADLVRHGLLIGFIVLVGWAAAAALNVAAVAYQRQFKLDAVDNLLARKHVTQIRILKRTASVLIGLLTLAAALTTIPGVRQFGVTLLAAGGAAGIVVGLALQPLLTNLIAGVQIAVTQPIRIDDAVIVEGEWGKVEEITATYVVVKIWDLRRLIVPLTWFIQNPFQNWTRETASLIGTAMIYVDYAAPVDAMRRKLQEIVEASPLWDGEVVNLAVTDLRERVMEVRCLVGARNSGDAFDLRTLVREKMIEFLQTEHPEALPRDRIGYRADPDAAGPSVLLSEPRSTGG